MPDSSLHCGTERRFRAAGQIKLMKNDGLAEMLKVIRGNPAVVTVLCSKCNFKSENLKGLFCRNLNSVTVLRLTSRVLA